MFKENLKICKAKILNSDIWVAGLCKVIIKDKAFKFYIKIASFCYEVDKNSIGELVG